MVDALLQRELERFEREHPRSRELASEARGSLLSGVPMPWMIRWPGGFPVFAAEANGARFTDVDGHEYVDFCLGDTAAMTGHSPEPTVRAVAEQAAQGITTMLPSEDAIWVGRELTRRFGLARWQFALTATDANRFAIRLARELTGRPKILVFNWCYHGSVDETFVGLEDGKVVSREGNVGPPVPLDETTRAVEWNDPEALARELAHGDVACVLAEPALTNIGIVLPEPGFHEQLRRATRETGTLLVIDETHTLCAGPGGYTAAYGLEPDLLTVGKSIGAGIPVAAYGFSAEVAERLEALLPADERADVGGIGGTVAANALSLAATRATLAEVLTDEAFERMIALGERFEAGVAEAIERHGLPWHVTRLGCRVEYLFRPERPRTGSAAAAGGDPLLDRLIHLYALNRGILLTPFHNMALISPATTEADVDRHTDVFDEAARELASCERLTGTVSAVNPNKALWEKGDFTRLAAAMRDSGQDLVASLGITPGLDVLDLGCGDGTTAVPAAQLGANVLGVDIASNLVAAGNERARELGLTNLRFQEGDASDLNELDDDSFDLVVSMFGAMFAPRPGDVAKEVVRVTRPGGRIVMGNWIPGDPTLVAQILRISSAYSPPPPEGFVSPMTWGVEADVTERFTGAGVPEEQISFERDTYVFRFPGSPSEYLAEFRDYYGPTMNAYEAAAADGREADLEAELKTLFEEKNTSGTEESTTIPATFLRVTVDV